MEKMVRDLIPQIMFDAGHSPLVRVAAENERLKWLSKKLCEEARELSDNPILDECADVYEVLMTLLVELQLTLGAVQEAAQRKRVAKGGFSRGYILTIRDAERS